MGVQIYLFSQEGCPGCKEQKSFLEEISIRLHIPVNEFDITKRPEYVRKYHLTITPTLLILVNGQEKMRFERIVSRGDLEKTLERYL
jgi:glutaredoxin